MCLEILTFYTNVCFTGFELIQLILQKAGTLVYRFWFGLLNK